MAAIGKIELDNWIRRAADYGWMRELPEEFGVPTGSVPYGWSLGDDGKPEIYEPEAEFVRRMLPPVLPMENFQSGRSHTTARLRGRPQESPRLSVAVRPS